MSKNNPPEKPKDLPDYLSKPQWTKDELPMLRMAHTVQLGSLSGRKKRKKRHLGKKPKKR